MKPPRQTTHLYGQKQALDFLNKAMARNTLPHALIFAGMQGIGKATCAYHLASSLLNNISIMNQQLPDNGVGKRIKAGTHGDLFVLENSLMDDKVKKPVIGIDQVRQLIAFTNKTAIEGGWRVIIIDSLDELNHQALNALLKRLEEPPAHCIFILIHHFKKDIPATIFSRCQQLIFQPLSPIELAEVLSDKEIALSHHNMNMIYQMAEGSTARALRLIRFKGDQLNDQIQNIIVELSQGNWQTCMTFTSNFLSPSKEHDIDDKLYLLGDILCFNLVNAQNVLNTNFMPAKIRQIFQRCSFDQLFGTWQNIHNLYRDFSSQALDPHQVAISSFNMIYQLCKNPQNSPRHETMPA